MAQKPLLKGKKAQPKGGAANRHGKVAKTKKGKYAKPPKRGVDKNKYEEDMALTKLINERNHDAVTGVAAQSGGRFKVITAPPVATTAHEKQTKKQQKAAARKGDDSDDDQ